MRRRNLALSEEKPGEVNANMWSGGSYKEHGI